MKMIPIVIVDYNTVERTEKYIDDAEKNIFPLKKTYIVVETGMDNELCRFEKMYYKLGEIKNIDYRIKFIKKYRTEKENAIYFIGLKENYGFAIANNIGACFAKKVLKEKMDILLFSNSDICFIEPIDLTYYSKLFVDNDSVAVIGPRVIGIDGKEQSPYRYIGLIKRWMLHFCIWPLDSVLHFLFTSSDKIRVDNTAAVYRVIGAFMLIRSEYFFEVNMFDENTFLYCEENILSERFISKGYITLYDPTFVIIHEEGNATKQIYNNDKRSAQQLKSELYYYRKYKRYNKSLIKLTEQMSYMYFWKRKMLFRLLRKE